MKQLILRDDNGKETLVRENLPDSIGEFDIVIRSDFLATKLWCEEDVRMELIEAGYSGCDDNVAKVVNTGHLKNLKDCTDSEWGIIRYAISEVEGSLVEMDTESKPKCPCSCCECGHTEGCPCDNAIPCSASCENITEDWGIKISACLREHCDTADIVCNRYLSDYDGDNAPFTESNPFPENYSEEDIEKFIEYFGEEIEYPYERKATFYEVNASEPETEEKRSPVILDDDAYDTLKKGTKESVYRAVGKHINTIFCDEQCRIGNLLRCEDLPGDIDPMSCLKLDELEEHLTDLITNVLMSEIPGSCFMQ